jgi:transcriptional regulator with XRE-family HTH domain
MKRSVLRILRAVRGWTQAEAAARLGISRGYLSRLENGSRMSSAVKKAVARVFRIGIRLLDAGAPISSSFVVPSCRTDAASFAARRLFGADSERKSHGRGIYRGREAGDTEGDSRTLG